VDEPVDDVRRLAPAAASAEHDERVPGDERLAIGISDEGRYIHSWHIDELSERDGERTDCIDCIGGFSSVAGLNCIATAHPYRDRGSNAVSPSEPLYITY
jgi:hypothetical protein